MLQNKMIHFANGIYRASLNVPVCAQRLTPNRTHSSASEMDIKMIPKLEQQTTIEYRDSLCLSNTGAAFNPWRSEFILMKI